MLIKFDRSEEKGLGKVHGITRTGQLAFLHLSLAMLAQRPFLQIWCQLLTLSMLVCESSHYIPLFTVVFYSWFKGYIA